MTCRAEPPRLLGDLVKGGSVIAHYLLPQRGDEPVSPLGGLFCVYVVGQSVANSFIVEQRSIEQGSESGEVAVLATARKQFTQDVAVTLLYLEPPDNSKA